MNFDLTTIILSALNATGIPLLAIGLILLLRAYQKSVEAYKDTSAHLRDENERLRKRINEMESNYYGDVERIREIVSKTITNIEDLRSQKATIVSDPKLMGNETGSSDVRKIDSAIHLLKELASAFKVFDLRLQEHVIYTQREFNNIASKMASSLEEVANNISFEPARSTILSAVASIEIYETTESAPTLESSGFEDKYLLERKISLLEKLIESDAIEAYKLEDASKELLTDVIKSLKSGKEETRLDSEDVIKNPEKSSDPKEITINLYTLHDREKVTKAKVPNDAPVKRLLPVLISKLGLPSSDKEGKDIVYNMYRTGSSKPLDSTDTFMSMKANDDDSFVIKESG